MKILIIGGTGFISSSITVKLLEKGHLVTVLTRGKTTARVTHPDIKYLYGDRDNADTLRTAAAERFDAVYDMIAYTPEQSETAVKIFRGNTGRFIHCSTISVYMISNDITIPITEDQDKAPVMEYYSRNPFGMDYGINKRKCEEILWKHYDPKKFPVSMVRPTFVSGPGDSAKRDYFWIERILDGKPLLVPGDGNYKFQQIYIDDCTEIFCRLINDEISVGEAYNAAAEETFTLNEYLHRLALLLGKHIDIIHIDQTKFDKLDISSSHKGDVFPFNTRRDAVFSLNKVKKHLDYSSTPFDVWMTSTIDWYLNVYKKHSVGYEYRDKESDIIKNIQTTWKM
jgi:nucleoside-diphosphate-sugar epimerase